MNRDVSKKNGLIKPFFTLVFIGILRIHTKKGNKFPKSTLTLEIKLL